MKSEYFSSKPSKIRGTREKKIEESVNWDRIVYLTMIGIAGFVLLYFIFDYYMIIEGKGRVMANRYEVRFPVDVRITDMYIEEGDSVQVSTPLFSFAIAHQAQSPEQSEDERRRLEEKIMDIEGDIAQEQAALNNAKDRMEYFEEQKELVKKEIRLGVSNVRDLRNIEREILDIKEDTTLASERLKKLQNERSTLQQWHSTSGMFGSFATLGMEGEFSEADDASGQFQTMDFATPSSGVVERVEKNVSELAVRSESILTIKRETPDLHIRAILQQNSLDYISKGDTLKVSFDSGTESRGIVSEFESPELSNWDIVGVGEYDNINRYVVIRLKPVDSEAFSVWNENSNMGVTIRKVVI